MTDFSKYPLKVKRSPIDYRDWKVSALKIKEVTLPIKTNNRATMPPFRDQEDLPTCAAMSAALVKYWQEKKDVGLNELLSPMFVYNNRSNSDDGMSNRDLMKILQNQGICLEKLYPYRTYKAPSVEACENAQLYRIKNYAQVDNLLGLKTMLYINGPVFFAVPVYNYTTRMWYQRPGDEFLGGHEMVIVDYNDETKKLLYRNHWSGFGDSEGYAEMSYDDFSLIWEYWTTIDLDNIIEPIPDPDPDPEPIPQKKSWISKNIWWMITGVVVILSVILYFR